MEEELLCDSTFCRLCAEENENGTLLFNFEENEQDLCNTINRYLPIKIQDDGKFPRTICPGCNIQLEAMVQFIELIIAGQERLRALWRKQQEIRKNYRTTQFLDQNLFDATSDIPPYSIRAIEESGKEILIQILPDGSLYAPDHEMSLKIEGLEKPKRKRGRPPKPPPGASPPQEETKKEEDSQELDDDMEEEIDGDNRKRRRRKVPFRFREAVQGKELERIFREEGVIDEEEVYEENVVNEIIGPLLDGTGNEVIGHLENKEGQDLGELIIVNKGKARLKTKSRRRKKFNCEICGRGFMHYGRYLVHKNFHKDVKYDCKTCESIFETKDELMEHQTSTGHAGEGIVENLGDDQKFEITQKDPDSQIIISQSVITPETIQISPEHKYPCNQCDKSFMSKQSFEVHVKAKHEGQKPFQCEKCDKTFAYHASLKGHMTSHEQKIEKGYPCDLCDKIFNHPSSVVYHKEAEHNNGRRFVCNKCNKSFKHKQLLQRHQLVHSEDRPFLCKSCGASFKTRANLLNHQPTHTGVKKYFCQQCGQLFAHKTSLTLHYRWHSGQKPYECNICKKTFSQKGNLREHKRIHTGEKPYSCDICSRKFTTSSQFKLHVKRHTGEKPWCCEFCNKTFLHKDTWKCHQRRHKNERPFQCTLCLRDFTEQWALKKHLRLHTGEKPYKCNLCPKAFADCSNLTKHRKVHRSKKGSELENRQADILDENVIYVHYQQDHLDANDLPAFVQILDNNDTTLNNVSSLTETDNNLSNNLIDETTELRLEDFVETTNLPLSAPLNVTDEEGNPIYFTGQDGQRVRVTSLDGQNLQICMDNGTMIPIHFNAENGKPIAIELDNNLKDKTIMEQHISLNPHMVEEKPIRSMESDMSQLMDQSVQFMTEDGQNVCLVATYNVDSDIGANYLEMT